MFKRKKDIIDVALETMKKYKEQMKKDIKKGRGRLNNQYYASLLLSDDTGCYELIIQRIDDNDRY